MEWIYSDERTSVTVLIPLFAFSLTTHVVQPFLSVRAFVFLIRFQFNEARIMYLDKKDERAVAASAESFDNCQSSSPTSTHSSRILQPYEVFIT